MFLLFKSLRINTCCINLELLNQYFINFRVSGVEKVILALMASLFLCGLNQKIHRILITYEVHTINFLDFFPIGTFIDSTHMKL